MIELMARLAGACLLASPAFATQSAAPASAQSGAQTSLAGDWDGTLTVPAGIKLPLILHFTDHGVTMDSPDQNATDIPVTVSHDGGTVMVEIPSSKARFAGALSSDGGTLSGPFTQGGLSMKAKFTHRTPGVAAPGQDRPQTPHPPYPYLTRDVTISSAPGVTLAGTLSQPKGNGPFPAVVMIAGSGPQNRDEAVSGHKIFLVIADRLTRNGIAVLRYDKRGVGQSKGDYRTATQADFATDAAAALQWLRRQPGVAPEKVGLIGHSEGAEIAPTVSETTPGVAHVVLLSTPALPGVEIIVAQQNAIALASGVAKAKADASSVEERRFLDADRAASDTASAAKTLKAMMLKAGMSEDRASVEAKTMAAPSYRTMLDDDPAPALRKLKVPALVVAGSKDLQVSPLQNLPVIRKALAGKAHVKIVELLGLNHLLQPAKTGTPAEYRTIPTTVDPRVLELLADWINQQQG